VKFGHQVLLHELDKKVGGALPLNYTP